jgi:WD40 repeat protein
MRALESCYNRLGQLEEAATCMTLIKVIENTQGSKLQRMASTLKDLKARLGNNNSVGSEFVVKIERTTLKAVQLREKIGLKDDNLEDYLEELRIQKAVVTGYAKLLEAIARETKEANETNEIEMISKLVHAVPQMVEVEELKTRLAVLETEEIFHLTDATSKQNKISTKINNTKDELKDFMEELEIEEGNVMKLTRLDKPFRCIAFCRFNAEGNEVTGSASDGVEWFAASEGSCIHCIDYHSGECQHVILGGDKTRVDMKFSGHSGIVTCLLHDGIRIYSGGTDELIISWDGATKELITVFKGHEGGVVALGVSVTLLASASADNTIRLWNKITGEQLRVLHGHSKSVLSLDIGEDWLLSGGADEEIRVWAIGKSGKYSIGATCVHRLIGHEAPVTCVRYGKLEVMSGDCLGRIFMWWMDVNDNGSAGTPYILHKISVHTGPVKCLQFDAIYIVSGGADATMCITDIATGDVMQTIRAHGMQENNEDDDQSAVERMKKSKGEKREKATKQVLAVAFDSERIISAGTDNTLRYWEWGKKVGAQDKHHILDKGQSLVAVSKLHSVPVESIMKWNGLLEVRQCFAGMKLIVRKGDPDHLTQGEKMSLARERRRDASLAKTDQRIGEGSASKPPKRSRVERFATDHNLTSMANRLSKQTKKDCELFPDQQDTAKDVFSLNGRMNTHLSSIDKFGGGKLRPIMEDYHMGPLNEAQWGPVADSLVTAMLFIICEYEAYDLAKEVLDIPRDKFSMKGRMHTNTQRERLEKEKEKERLLALANSELSVDALGTIAEDHENDVSPIPDPNLNPYPVYDPNPNSNPNIRKLNLLIEKVVNEESLID